MNMDKDRLIAFTDAIIAIAATIMVLELVTPKIPTFAGLISQWPVFLAYVNSFIFIYVVWFNHHNAFDKIKNLSVKVFILNGLWVFIITLVPFTTKWVGMYPFSTVPEFVYSIILLMGSIVFQIMDNQILKDDPTLNPDFTNDWKIRIPWYGILIAAIIVSFIIPIFSIILIMILVIFTIILLIIRMKN